MTFAEAEECEARHIAEASTNAAMRGESLDACRCSECGHSPNTASHECVKHMPTAVERLPDELLLMIFEMLSRDTKTLMTVVPAVCRRWRAVYVHTRNVHLDFDSALSQARVRLRSGDLGARMLSEIVKRMVHVVVLNPSGMSLTDASRHCPHLTNVNFASN